MAFALGLLFFAGVPFAICFSLGVRRRGRGAWWGAGAIAALALAVAVPLWTGEYEAGLAGFAIILFTATVLLPAVLGALLGAGTGRLVWWLRQRPR